ncbi:hypothetical protein QBC35DRAFT_241871 [Podospora australis]|uniref:Cytochrome b561 domain-containing protein n=1 Tax=Podospora australis TaxID=1536484 RepID=A0AAN7AN23_9PEZI|nr:hypothetical protein QBC35DRAFT_241871 [Podospora australis]
MATIRLFLSTLLLLSSAQAQISPAPKPPKVQYCRFGHSTGDIDFCMGLSIPRSVSNQSNHDLHISLSVRRSEGLGWTAVGTGPYMAGSLMFIVYGDPLTTKRPVVSIRSVDGHHQPQVVEFLDEMTGQTVTGPLSPGGATLRVVKAEWVRLGGRPGHERRHEEDEHTPKNEPTGPPTHAARVEVVCEACNLFSFPGQKGSVHPTSSSMPWIWAWNERQDFNPENKDEKREDKEPKVDVKLHMHRHHANSGGFGGFWVDMAAAATTTQNDGDEVGTEEKKWFDETKENERIGTSENPMGVGGWLDYAVGTWSVAKAHGVLMGLAFMGLFPLGVVFMRSNGGRANGGPFKRHWRVQMLASMLAFGGAVLGGVISRWRMPKTVHQWLGAAIVGVMVVQSILGWRHHMTFLRLKRRTWISHVHIALGRVIVLGGWVNVMLGLLLSGKGFVGLGLVGALVLMEAIFVTCWVWRAQKKAAAIGGGSSEGLALMPVSSAGTDYFAISDEDDDDDDMEGVLMHKNEEIGG